MRKEFLLMMSLMSLSIHPVAGQTNFVSDTVTKTIFAYGDLNKVFLRYVISLTNKTNPRICFLPTASGDDIYDIADWYELCSHFRVQPSIQRVFISADSGQKSFEENLLQMDAIVVGGGNTLNMIGIWKAQGIDTVLKKAYEKGVILAGGSAGALCWFKDGITDSRPQRLTIIQALGFINTSHCPHFSSQKERRPLYEQFILEHKISPGYACDDLAGMLFQNGKLVKAVSLDAENHVYYISARDGKINEEKLNAEIIK